jgi:hypothetical protein
VYSSKIGSFVSLVLDLNPHLVALQVKFKELASDASPLLRGETIFFVDIDLHKDELFAICSTMKQMNQF